MTEYGKRCQESSGQWWMEEQECGGEAGVLPHQGLYCYTACVWEMSAKLSNVQDFVNQLSFFGDSNLKFC